MTYDMGKKVNMGREPCMHERQGREVQGEETNFMKGKAAERVHK